MTNSEIIKLLTRENCAKLEKHINIKNTGGYLYTSEITLLVKHNILISIRRHKLYTGYVLFKNDKQSCHLNTQELLNLL